MYIFLFWRPGAGGDRKADKFSFRRAISSSLCRLYDGVRRRVWTPLFIPIIRLKKSYQLISRILSPPEADAIIDLARPLLVGSCCLPSGIERAVLSRRFAWHYSMQGLPESFIAERLRGLLPHVFTFIRQRRKVIFCGTFCSR